MALDLFFDGFDHQNAYSDLATGNKWTGTDSGVLSVSIDATTFRFNGKSLKLLPGGGVYKNTPGAETVVVLGFALTYTLGSAPEVFVYSTANQTGVNVTLTVDQVNAQLQLRSGGNNGSVLGSSGNGTFEPATWYYVEVEILAFSVASGAAKVYINGTKKIDVSSANTAPSATHCNSFTLMNDSSGSQPCWFDDFYFHNEGGSAPFNAVLGDTRVETLFPTSDSSVAFTHLSGANNYGMVDEVAMDGDTTYNYSSTPAQTDLFGHGALSNTPTTIFAAAVTSAIRQESASTRAIQNEISSSGNVADGTAVVPGVTYQYQQDIFINDPNTSSAWAAAALNSAIFGYNLEA